MFLNSEEEIKNWFLTHTTTLETFFDYICLVQKDNYIEINSLFSISFCFKNLNNLEDIIKELPIKFGTIEGNFNVYNSNLESFKGFPDIIKKDLNISGNFKSGKDWNIKEVYGSINLCGEHCELDNINFLENTEFNKFNVKVYDTPFKNNCIPEEYDHYTHSTYDAFFIKKEGIVELIKKNKLDTLEIEDYLNSFNDNLDKNLDN